MYTNYDLLAFKMLLPEVNLLADRCEVKMTFVGKDPEIQTQLAITSCVFTSLKNQEFEVVLQPDLIRIDSNVRTSVQGMFERPSGLGLVNARIKIVVTDLLGKVQANIYFKRGSNRKWSLEGIELAENVEIDRNILREKRRKLRRSIGDIR